MTRSASRIFWELNQVHSPACHIPSYYCSAPNKQPPSLLYPSKRHSSFFCILQLFDFASLCIIFGILYRPFRQSTASAQYEDIYRYFDNCWYSYHRSSRCVTNHLFCASAPTLTSCSVCRILRLPETEQPRLSQSAEAGC